MNEIPSFFSKLKSVQPLSNQEEPDNMQPKLFAVQSFFKTSTIQDKTLHSSYYSSNKENLITQEIMIAWTKRRTLIKS